MSDAFISVAASAYNAGWSAHAYEVARQKADPNHSIIRRNPFEARLELERQIQEADTDE